MKKLARAIVKMRRLILIAAVLLLIPAAVGAIATPINYDILSYLPQELDSRVGQLSCCWKQTSIWPPPT